MTNIFTVYLLFSILYGEYGLAAYSACSLSIIQLTFIRQDLRAAHTTSRTASLLTSDNIKNFVNLSAFLESYLAKPKIN